MSAPRLKAWVIGISGCLTWAEIEGFGKVGLMQAEGYAEYWQGRADALKGKSDWLVAVEQADFWADVVMAIRRDRRSNHEQR
jgi:hypothetical protein